jgi:SAM-dependent methyltransferase
MTFGKNPADTLMQISGGHCVSRALHVVADLGMADALGDVPQTAATLAATTGTNPDILARVLRLLAGYGIFDVQDGAFAHTAASRLLRSDHPQSLRSFVRMMGFPANWRVWEALGDSVRTGGVAARSVMPNGVWTYFAEHPEEGRIFDEAMTGFSHATIPAIVEAYDFSRFNRIADIGGGYGHLLRAVLRAAPTATGVVFDLPQVVEQAALEPLERLRFEAGSFFDEPLPICDAYLIMGVLHDWNDENATNILRAVRRAAPSDATVLVIETIVPDDPARNWERILDMHMLALHGAKERTETGIHGVARCRRLSVRTANRHARRRVDSPSASLRGLA